MKSRGTRYLNTVVTLLAAEARSAIRRLKEMRLGLERVPPNYAFRARFRSGDVAVDVGTGDDPDLSRYLIANYGLECFAVDPTRKHAPALKALERELAGFHYLPYALGPQCCKVRFYESKVNVSGSVLLDHRNIVNDPVVSYSVDMVTLEELLRIVGKDDIALMKIDIEGAEYDLIRSLDLSLLRRIRQLIVEFHHGTVAGITWRDTGRSIARVERSGMKAFVYNGRDCYFHW